MSGVNASLISGLLGIWISVWNTRLLGYRDPGAHVRSFLLQSAISFSIYLSSSFRHGVLPGVIHSWSSTAEQVWPPSHQSAHQTGQPPHAGLNLLMLGWPGALLPGQYWIIHSEALVATQFLWIEFSVSNIPDISVLNLLIVKTNY